LFALRHITIDIFFAQKQLCHSVAQMVGFCKIFCGFSSKKKKKTLVFSMFANAE